MSPLDVSSFPDSVQLPTEQDRTNSIPSRSHRRRLFGSLLGGTKDVAQLWRAPRRRASEASVQVIPTESEPQTVLDLRSSEAPLAAPAHAGHPSEERAALPLTLATSTTELIVSPRDNPVSESPENLFPPTPVAEDFPEKNHVKESIKALRLSRIHRAQDWARKPEDDALPPWASRGVIDSFGLPDDYRDEREADRTRMSSGTTGSSSTSSWRPSAPSSPSTSRSSYWSAATSSTAATPTSPWSAKPRGSGLSTSIAPSRPFSGVSSQSSKSARSGKSGKRPVTPPHLSGGAMMRLRSLSSSSDKGKDKAPSTPPNTLDPRPRTLSGGPGPVASAAGQPVVAAAARSKSTTYTRSRTHSNPENKSRAASSILTAPSPSRSVATPTLSTSQSSAGSRPLPDVPSVRPPQTIKSTKQQPSPIGPRQAGKHKHSVPARPEEGIPTPAGYETSTIAAFPSSHKASSLPAPLNGANTSPQIRQTPLPPTDPSIIHAPINPSRIKPGGPSRSVPVTSPTFASTGDGEPQLYAPSAASARPNQTVSASTVSSRDAAGSSPTATSTAHPLCPVSPSEPEHVMAPWSLKPRTSNSGGLTSPTPSSSSLPHRSYESLRAYGRSFGHSARASVASSPASPPRSHSPVNMFTTVPEAAVSSDLPMLPTSSGSLGQRSTPSFASSTTSKRSASPVNMYSNMDSLFGTAPKPRPLVKLDKSKKDKGKQTQRSPEPPRPVEPQRSPEPRRAPEPRPSVSRAPQPSASRSPQPSVARASSASARIGRSSGSLMRRPKTSESQSAQPRASTSSRYRSTRPSTANSTGSAASDTTIPIAFLNGDPVYTDTPRKVNLSRASVWGPTRPSTGGSHVEPPPLVEPGATPLGEQPVNVVVQSREKGVWEERDVQDVIYQLRKIRAK